MSTLDLAVAERAHIGSQSPSIGKPKPATPSAEPQTASLKTWIAVIGSTLGAFMAILDIQIVNASLADIQGAIGAGIDEGGWVSTAYLVGEIIVIPLTGWLAQVVSVRRYLLVNAALFLLFSAGCAFARDLGEMIALRACQGFTGGVLIPMAFTIVMTMLPKANRPVGMALFALSATFAPAIGPTIGGYLTENWGWQYIFYANLLPGPVMLLMLWSSLERAPMNLALLKVGDWPGIATMAIGLGALQTVLEEGNKHDWFGSPYIVRLSLVAAVSLTLFVAIELSVERPLLNLRLLFRRNFGFGALANFLMGSALYGSIFILPVYLSLTQGYNAQQIGMVLAWTGLPQLLLIPLVPQLMKRFDARVIVGVGLTLFALSNFMNVHLSHDVAADQLFWPNIVRAVGQAVIMAPLAAIATAGIEAENAGSASALFNMLRNLGGAIGIATLQTFLTHREQYHSNLLTPSVTLFGATTRERIDELSRYFLSHGISDPSAAWHQAVVAIARSVRLQSYVMAFADTFYLIGAGLVVALVATMLLKKPENLQLGSGH